MFPMSSSGSHNAQRHPDANSGSSVPRRQGSFLGSFKNAFTNPLSWFAGTGALDSNDMNGKRRRPVQNDADETRNEEENNRQKRIRRKSPDRLFENGYLDPPSSAFEQNSNSAVASTSRSQNLQSNGSSYTHHRATSAIVPSSTVHFPLYSRHTASPVPTSPSARFIGQSRTMSMDPPALSKSLRGNTSAQDFRHTSPSNNSLRSRNTTSTSRMRSSMTPQITHSRSEAGFDKKERESEPPSVSTLMSNPMFVRAPTPGKQTNVMTRTSVTLGSLVESRRRTHSPVRQGASQLFGSGSSTSHSNVTGSNAAERALHELDVYKTPLLPTRLRGSTVIPEMFRPKKAAKRIILMQKELKGDSPKLGRNTTKAKEVNESKPYAGQSGMKRMLAKRKDEAEKEMAKEKAEAMEDESKVEAPEKEQSSENTVPVPEVIAASPPAPSAFDFRPRDSSGRQQSSLRVGRTKTNHVARPVSRQNNGRFSAAYEEEDGEDKMNEERARDRAELEQVAKNVPEFKLPSGFSFGPPPPATKPEELNKAKEPPVISLPFSLTRPASAITEPTKEAPKEKVLSAGSSAPAPPPSAASAFAFSAPSAPTPAPVSAFSLPKSSESMPMIMLAPPTPEPPSTGESSEKKVPSLPNFFASSSLANKAPPPLVIPDRAPPTQDDANPLWQGDKAVPASEAKPPQLFSGFGTTSTESPSAPSIFAVPPAAGSLFGNTSGTATPAPAPLFGAPAASGGSESTTKPPVPSLFTFGSSIKTAEGATSASSGDAQNKAPETSTTPLFGNVTAPSDAKKLTPLNSLFGNQTASVERTKTTSPWGASLEPAKPTAGTSPFASSGSGFTFGAAASTPVPTSTPSEPAKTVFTFGAPTPSTPAAEPAKENKPGFTFSQPSSAVDTASRPSPFTFGGAPSTPPAEKKLFNFGPPAQSAAAPTVPSFSFGAPNSGSATSDVSSKPLSFNTPSTVTPSKTGEQEVTMDESPVREAQAAKPSSGFGFTPISSTGLFGQPAPSSTPAASPFSFAGPSAANPFAKPEVKVEEKSPMTFGGFRAAQPSAGFSFGQKVAEAPPTAGGFSFSAATPTTATATPSFFGGSNSSVNPFAQAQSTPASPAGFASSTPFTFSAPSAPPMGHSTSFGFGSSQPASPAPANVSLPGTAFSFGGSNPAAASAASPFLASTPPPSGGSLFTIGAAPAPGPTTPGGRQFKKLPNRRPTTKR